MAITINSARRRYADLHFTIMMLREPHLQGARAWGSVAAVHKQAPNFSLASCAIQDKQPTMFFQNSAVSSFLPEMKVLIPTNLATCLCHTYRLTLPAHECSDQMTPPMVRSRPWKGIRSPRQASIIMPPGHYGKVCIKCTHCNFKAQGNSTLLCQGSIKPNRPAARIIRPYDGQHQLSCKPCNDATTDHW